VVQVVVVVAVVAVVVEARSAAIMLAVPVGKASDVVLFMLLQVLVIVIVNVCCDSMKPALKPDLKAGGI